MVGEQSNLAQIVNALTHENIPVRSQTQSTIIIADTTDVLEPSLPATQSLSTEDLSNQRRANTLAKRTARALDRKAAGIKPKDPRREKLPSQNARRSAVTGYTQAYNDKRNAEIRLERKMLSQDLLTYVDAVCEL